MDGHDDDESSSHEDHMNDGPKRSNNLDLNIEQACSSPRVAHVSSVQSTSSRAEVSDEVIKVGMMFESDEHAYRFYSKYAKLVGFNVRKDWVNRSKVHGRVVSRKFTCSKEGHRRKDKRDANVKRHRKETRTGCLAHMIINRQTDGTYRVTHFEGKHNHGDINQIDTQKLQELTSQETVDVTGVTEADLPSNLKKQTKLASHFLGRRFVVRENIDYRKMNFGDYLKSRRVRDLKEGEAGRLLYYFQRQHFENPSFLYSIQLDCDDRISNIFWADDHMVVDYDHFGDVICLDATYRTNEDFLPFVQFLGLNHHRQVMIFGAALMYDDTIDSVKWLLQMFIEVMSGKKPKVILTDQDATIIQAIGSVLPEVNHHVCVWQMYQNALNHLRHVTKYADSFAKDLRSCIFNQEDEEDFIHAWDAMIEKFSLQQNDWLKWTLREKEKWAVVYGKNRFFMDKESTHLVEYFSNCLKDHLKSDLEVLQFFKNYEFLVNEQRYKELEANYEAEGCTPNLMANVVLLKNASEYYTPKAFELFQREYEICLNVVVNQCSENGLLFEYKTSIFGQPSQYTVSFDSSDATVTCSCMMFEHVGVLCCHALKVLDHRNIKMVPVCYILKRWTKDARAESPKKSSGISIEENPKSLTASRYKELCNSLLKISARAADSDQAFEYASRKLDEVIQGVEKILTVKFSEENHALTPSSMGTNASESAQAEIFLDRNTNEGEDNSNTFKGTNEREITAPNNGKVNNLIENISKIKRCQNAHRSGTGATTSCPSPAYVSSSTSSLNPIAQCLCSFQANQVVQCPYRPSSVTMHKQPNPNIYQAPDYSLSQQDSSYQAELLQAMDLDVHRPNSASFVHGDHRYRVPND